MTGSEALVEERAATLAEALDRRRGSIAPPGLVGPPFSVVAELQSSLRRRCASARRRKVLAPATVFAATATAYRPNATARAWKRPSALTLASDKRRSRSSRANTECVKARIGGTTRDLHMAESMGHLGRRDRRRCDPLQRWWQARHLREHRNYFGESHARISLSHPGYFGEPWCEIQELASIASSSL
jgi:hypothetical protein